MTLEASADGAADDAFPRGVVKRGACAILPAAGGRLRSHEAATGLVVTGPRRLRSPAALRRLAADQGNRA